jgi:hypothetical protein
LNTTCGIEPMRNTSCSNHAGRYCTNRTGHVAGVLQLLILLGPCTGFELSSSSSSSWSSPHSSVNPSVRDASKAGYVLGRSQFTRKLQAFRCNARIKSLVVPVAAATVSLPAFIAGFLWLEKCKNIKDRDHESGLSNFGGTRDCHL